MHQSSAPALNRAVVQAEFEMEIQAHIDAERARLRAEPGLARMREFKKPVERTFTASERDHVTILFGGLTWKHEEVIKGIRNVAIEVDLESTSFEQVSTRLETFAELLR